MTFFIRYIDDAEMAGLAVAACVILFVGNRISLGLPRTRRFCAGLAGLALLVYLAVQAQTGSHALGEQAMRGLLAAGIVLGTSWILAPIVVAIYDAITGTLRGWKNAIFAFFRGWMRGIQDRRESSRGEARYVEIVAKQQREKEEAESLAKVQAEAQKRRQDARGRCEVQFVTHSFELRERFNREMFDAFVSRHLGDDKTPEYVERLAAELCDIINKHLEKTDGGAKKSLADLAAWFLKEKKQIEETALGDDDKETLIAQLEERYVRLQEKHLRSVKP